MPSLADLRVIIALDFTVSVGPDRSGWTALVEALQSPPTCKARRAQFEPDQHMRGKPKAIRVDSGSGYVSGKLMA